MPKLETLDFKNVILLGAPLLAVLISEFLMILADSAMVGRLGTDYLAAIVIASMFGELLWVIVWPMAIGTHTIAVKRLGRQKKNSSQNIYFSFSSARLIISSNIGLYVDSLQVDDIVQELKRLNGCHILPR